MKTHKIILERYLLILEKKNNNKKIKIIKIKYHKINILIHLK